MATYTATGTGSPVTVTGLPAGNYRFTVKASNSSGSGAASASSATVTTTGGSTTTGPLYQRCSFGAYADEGNAGTSDHAALEATLGATLKRMNTYQNMSSGGDSGWPTSVANWCTSTGHDLDISWDCSANGPSFATILAGGNNATLDAFFQQCKAFSGTVYLRMWWEMNDQGGPTKPGNGGLCANRAQWIQTWQYVYNRCKVTNGCTNVKFNYCPSGTDQNSLGNTIENVYPGSSYVDEIGFDAYNTPDWAPWQSFDSLMGSFYDRICALHPTAPVCLGEVGTSNNDPDDSSQNKATWLAGLFTSQKFPRMRNINFFSANQGGNENWRLDQTSASVAVCRQYLSSAPAKG